MSLWILGHSVDAANAIEVVVTITAIVITPANVDVVVAATVAVVAEVVGIVGDLFVGSISYITIGPPLYLKLFTQPSRH